MSFKQCSHFLSSFLLRGVLLPFSFLPYKTIHKIGHFLGKLFFPFLVRYKKRALSNLAIASDLNLSIQEIKKYAVESLANLFITTLEYGKLSQENKISHIVTCVNPEVAEKILSQGQGIIFSCAHQANWELFFLEGTSRMKGVAIGQPIKNTYLYEWILKIREKFGGIIIEPKQATKEGLKALKRGEFLGIVGDQGMPEGGFCTPFLGRKAFTSPLPALLSYKSGTPLIVATMIRKEGNYFIHYSDPLWPNLNCTLREEIPRLMQASLHLLEESIKKNPGQWLWQHNKWKQQGPNRLKKKYRHDTIAIFFPQENWEPLLDELKTFREIYPTEFFTLFLPQNAPIPKDFEAEIKIYQTYQEIKQIDYRFKLIFNFTSDDSLSQYFKKLAAFETLNLEKIQKICPNKPFSTQLKRALLHAS